LTHNSETYRYSIPESGHIHITVSLQPTRVNVHCGKHGGPLSAMADRMGAICGQALRGGVPASKLVDGLVDTRHDRSPSHRNGDPADRWKAYSVPDAIGCAIRERFLSGMVT
jgi:hypothetical protein